VSVVESGKKHHERKNSLFEDTAQPVLCTFIGGDHSHPANTAFLFLKRSQTQTDRRTVTANTKKFIKKHTAHSHTSAAQTIKAATNMHTDTQSTGRISATFTAQDLQSTCQKSRKKKSKNATDWKSCAS
jgi:hypothetical protein